MNSPVILFDGVCNLCNRAVQFIIKNDRKEVFKFASLQSEFAQNFLKSNKLATQDFSTLILIQDGQYFNKSIAIFKIVKNLPNYSWLSIFAFLPLFFTDFVYDLISNNRFKWFGKRASCWLPNSELKDRFL
jgi:predicted DCC family thiol-disulfide oxidoreductase YuxK